MWKIETKGLSKPLKTKSISNFFILRPTVLRMERHNTAEIFGANIKDSLTWTRRSRIISNLFALQKIKLAKKVGGMCVGKNRNHVLHRVALNLVYLNIHSTMVKSWQNIFYPLFCLKVIMSKVRVLLLLFKIVNQLMSYFKHSWFICLTVICLLTVYLLQGHSVYHKHCSLEYCWQGKYLDKHV